MTVRVKLFAAAKELVDRDDLDVELPDNGSVADLRAAIAREYPALETIARHAMFAVNADYANDNTKIRPGAEVACIPPVSGG